MLNVNTIDKSSVFYITPIKNILASLYHIIHSLLKLKSGGSSSVRDHISVDELPLPFAVK